MKEKGEKGKEEQGRWPGCGPSSAAGEGRTKKQRWGNIGISKSSER